MEKITTRPKNLLEAEEIMYRAQEKTAIVSEEVLDYSEQLIKKFDEEFDNFLLRKLDVSF